MIIDEASFLEEEYIENLKNLKSQVASLWIAVGSIGIDVQKLREKALDLGFTCPTLEHCLRNASDIAELSTKQNYSYRITGDLSMFSDNVKVKAMTNKGILKRIEAIYQDEIQATKEALLTAPQNKKCFIFIGSDSKHSMSDFKKTIPEHDFESFDDEQARQAWFASSSNDTNHLVSQASHYFGYAIRGLEFDQLIYIYPTCLKCGYECPDSSIITRAKASLILSSYGVESCSNCPKKY